MKIAILYIAIGKYAQFWDNFYENMNSYFLTEHNKTYFVFSDNEVLKGGGDVCLKYVQDKAWPFNTLDRFEMFLTVKTKLLKYDYIFFCNANYVPLQNIFLDELLGKKKLCCLSWNVYNKNTFPYERNLRSEAYIAHNDGKQYCQGGFNGGYKKDFLDLIEKCYENTEKDKKNGITAISHDESHLNKYLLNKDVNILETKYGRPQEWKIPKNPKAIFLDKNTILGKEYMTKIKGREISWKKLPFRIKRKIKSILKIK